MLYLIHHAGQGGTERYVQMVAQGLRDSGRVTPYFAYTERGVLAERMEAMGIPSTQLPMPGRYNLAAARRIAALCREKNIDVIHAQFLRENYLALMSRMFYKKPKAVYTNHLILPNNFLTRMSNRILSQGQHGVIAVCNPGAAQMIKNGIPAKKIRVIHNGVDPESWRAAVQQPRETHAPPSVLYAARLVEGKGHLFLIEALSRIKNVPYRLTLAGDGPLKNEVLAEAERKGVPVNYLGFQTDMPSVLAGADIAVNAASTEACSFNILEAMAAGLPQVVVNAGGNADLIDGENGLLVEEGDVQGLSDALSRLLTDDTLRSHCAQKAEKAVNQRFHINEMLRKTYSVYQGEVSNGTKETL